jgi:fumarate reductase subunit C
VSVAAGARPRWYRQRMPIFWWLGKAAYVRFIVRELTSLGVAWAAVLLIVEVAALGRGEAAHRRFVEALAHPVAIAANLVLLAVLVFHATTWLALAPKAMVVRVGGRRIPDGVVLAAHLLAWLGASALVLWIAKALA